MQFTNVEFMQIDAGVIAELVNRELVQVIKNIQDVNTPHKNKREINIKLGFWPESDRTACKISIAVNSKLVPVNAHETIAYLQLEDENTPKVTGQDPDQLTLFDTPAKQETEI